MSLKSDVFLHFCNDIYRKRMSLEERAELLIDMYEDLDYEDYHIINNESFSGYNMEKAMNDLDQQDLKDQKKVAQKLWDELSMINIDENDEIITEFNPKGFNATFEAGTLNTEIWTWFEDTFNLSVVDDLEHN